jgi:hypothetical protein
LTALSAGVGQLIPGTSKIYDFMRKTARQNTKIGATKKRAVRFRKPGQPKQLALNRLPQIASDRLPQTACFSGDGMVSH